VADHRLGAVILAAGRSRRQKGFKPLLPLGQSSVLDCCLNLFQQAGITGPRKVVVLGHRSEELRPLVIAAGATPVVNADYDRGMFSSVQAGVNALPASINAFFVLPVDIPLVRHLTIQLLSQALSDHDQAQVLLPNCADRTGHPPLLRAGLRAAIADHDGSRGLRGVLDRAACVQIPVPDEGMLVDIDRPEDYQRAVELWHRASLPSPTEAEVLLDLQCADTPDVQAHCRTVARIAARLAKGIMHGSPDQALDQELIVSAALLHDIAKGEPNHAAAGASRLTAMGFDDRLAAIVASHADCDPSPGTTISETEVVCLADKLVQGSRLVDLQDRFQASLERFSNNPEAIQAVHRRWRQARSIAERIEQACGHTISALLSGPA